MIRGRIKDDFRFHLQGTQPRKISLRAQPKRMGMIMIIKRVIIFSTSETTVLRFLHRRVLAKENFF
jgi:hypothetical protein